MKTSIELIREVEPILQASMADDPKFISFLDSKIAKKEALVIRDKNNNNKLTGLITISHNNNRISWFAVSERYRRMGVGSTLLEYAINELDSSRDIEVTTFQEGYLQGIPARRTYQKFGFIDYDLSVKMDGFPRSLMKRFARKHEID